jgi:hypothetical protein
MESPDGPASPTAARECRRRPTPINAHSLSAGQITSGLPHLADKLWVSKQEPNSKPAIRTFIRSNK